ncbi:hypothetical protein JHW43_000729 [Diplocarpon mali]|nr:hypothetical protein JHW43_000729 [Diplocarpon mali]
MATLGTTIVLPPLPAKTTSAMKRISSGPAVRALVIKSTCLSNIPKFGVAADIKHIEAAWGETRGVVQPTKCVHCSLGDGPFEQCVRVAGEFGDGCTNCHVRGEAGHCSHANGGITTEKGLVRDKRRRFHDAVMALAPGHRQAWVSSLPSTARRIDIVGADEAVRRVDPENEIVQAYVSTIDAQIEIFPAHGPLMVALTRLKQDLKTDNRYQKVIADDELLRIHLSDRDLLWTNVKTHPLYRSFEPQRKTLARQIVKQMMDRRYTYFVGCAMNESPTDAFIRQYIAETESCMRLPACYPKENPTFRWASATAGGIDATDKHNRKACKEIAKGVRDAKV